MTKLNKKEKEHLKESIEALQHLINACNGDNTRCGVFDSLYDDYKYNLKLYISSWCLAPLEKLESTTI